MRYGSVCSGIEAASVAWHSLGWTPAWLAEVDVSASAVLAHRLGATAPRYPLAGTEKSLNRIQWGSQLVNWGDMTRLPEAVRTGAAEAPDILCGGTPCTGFSVAGLRDGLRDPRSQLAISFIHLANAIDDRRSSFGQQPSVIFWENVPGVRSDSQNAFGHFLAALVGVENPIEPGPRPQPGRSSAHWTWKKETSEHVAKWSSAGAVAGPRRTVAWRSSDAQFFALAQRRERVFLVASAREGFDPQVVLFEFDGLRRDSAPSRDAGESVAGTTDEGAYRGSHCDNPANPHPSLNQSFNTGGIGQSNQELFSQRGAYLVGDRPVGAAELTPQWWDGSPVSQRLDAVLHKGQTMPEKNRFPAVLQPVIPILEAGARTGNSTTDPRAGIGIGIDGDPMFTLQSSKQHAVAVMPFNTTQITSPENGSNPQWGDPCFSLAAGNHPPAVAISVALRGREGGSTAELGDDVAGTLRASGGGGDKPHVLAFSSNDYGNDVTADLAPTMRAMNHSGSHQNGGGQLAVCVTGDITHTLTSEGFDASEDGTGRGQPIIADYLERRHADAYEADASSVLSTLLKAVGAEAYAKWGFGILVALHSPEVLRTWLHGASLRGATEENRPWVDDSALPRSEDSAAGRLLRQVWTHGPNGCSSQGRGLAKQLAGKSGEALSVLSHQGASREDILRVVRETAEGVRILLEALPAVREVGRPEDGNAQWGDMSVRRLMPVEAERLMGFPDGWTLVPVGKGMAADGPRYKQLGNSWAVPCVSWIGRRLDLHLAELDGMVIDAVPVQSDAMTIWMCAA